MGKRFVAGALLVITGFGIFSFTYENNYFEIAKNLDIFATLFKEVNTYYVDEIDPEDLINSGISSMLQSLDPYTNYIPEEELDEYRTMTTGEYAGIGSLIGQVNGVNVITMPNRGFPADKAGLKIGDELLTVDGIDVTEKAVGEISSLLKGKSKTSVKVTVRRYGQEEPLEFEIVRDKIIINNVQYSGMLSDDIGYLRLSDFTTDATKEVKSALVSLKKEGAEKLVIDLRGNPGGLLYEAVNICNLFIPKGMEVVSTKGKVTAWNKTYKTLNEAFETEMPLALITNNGSASASEIVAGVMQDYDRGVIVGRKTFGKGLVQATRPLSYNAQLKITTAKYYIPSGRCIQSVDYSNKNADGSSNEIPDSLRTEFQTKNGRTVLDGGGISPDIEVETEYLAPITISLISKGLLFNYATQFAYDKGSIGDARDFEMTDKEYDQFISWLSDKQYDYKTSVEKGLEDLVASAKQEKYFELIESDISQLQKQVTHHKDEDLVTYKEQIKSLLEESISARFYLVTGEIETSFDNDMDIKAAVDILKNEKKYEDILKAQGE